MTVWYGSCSMLMALEWPIIAQFNVLWTLLENCLVDNHTTSPYLRMSCFFYCLQIIVRQQLGQIWSVCIVQTSLPLSWLSWQKVWFIRSYKCTCTSSYQNLCYLSSRNHQFHSFWDHSRQQKQYFFYMITIMIYILFHDIGNISIIGT